MLIRCIDCEKEQLINPFEFFAEWDDGIICFECLYERHAKLAGAAIPDGPRVGPATGRMVAVLSGAIRATLANFKRRDPIEFHLAVSRADASEFLDEQKPF